MEHSCKINVSRFGHKSPMVLTSAIDKSDVFRNSIVVSWCPIFVRKLVKCWWWAPLMIPFSRSDWRFLSLEREDRSGQYTWRLMCLSSGHILETSSIIESSCPINSLLAFSKNLSFRTLFGCFSLTRRRIEMRDMQDLPIRSSFGSERRALANPWLEMAGGLPNKSVFKFLQPLTTFERPLLLTEKHWSSSRCSRRGQELPMAAKVEFWMRKSILRNLRDFMLLFRLLFRCSMLMGSCRWLRFKTFFPRHLSIPFTSSRFKMSPMQSRSSFLTLESRKSLENRVATTMLWQLGHSMSDLPIILWIVFSSM